MIIFSAGLMADVFTTKAGFNRGYSDYNLLYNLANRRCKKLGNNSFLLLGGFGFGALRVGIMYLFWADPLILLLVASLTLLGPLWNSVMLAYPESKRQESKIELAP